MASLDPVVDLYNAVSLRYAVPVGGENSAAYCGSPRLVFADGSETFDTLKKDNPPPSRQNRAKLSGAMTEASPVGAGTGVREYVPD